MIRTSNVSVRKTLRKLLPPSVIELVARETGAFKRIRRISPVAFVWSLVFGCCSGRRRSLAGMRRIFNKLTRQNQPLASSPQGPLGAQRYRSRQADRQVERCPRARPASISAWSLGEGSTAADGPGLLRLPTFRSHCGAGRMLHFPLEGGNERLHRRPTRGAIRWRSASDRARAFGRIGADSSGNAGRTDRRARSPSHLPRTETQ